MKYCNKCGIELVEGENWYLSYVKAGNYVCKECGRARQRQWHKTNREEENERCRQWRGAHLDYFRHASQQYYSKHREKRLAYFSQWRRDYPERCSVYDHRRRARKANLPATLTETEWQGILEKHDHCCAYCDRDDLPLEREHKIPVSRGGGYTAENIVPACLSCNRRKGAKTYDEFLELLAGEKGVESDKLSLAPPGVHWGESPFIKNLTSNFSEKAPFCEIGG